MKTLSKNTGQLKRTVYSIGTVVDFIFQFFKSASRRPFELRELLLQSYKVGNNSLPIVLLMAFIIGVVFSIQSHPALEAYGATSWLPSLVSVSLVREIAPVVTAIVCAGNVSSSIAAETGSMRVTEQIDAIEVSGSDPFKYLIVPRVLAATLMIPLLVIFADAIALYGSYLGISLRGEGVITLRLFITQVFDKLTLGDFLPSLIKSFLFGFAIGITGCYQGFHAKRGTEGVGRATNTSVVVSIFSVFIIDLVVTQIADMLRLT